MPSTIAGTASKMNLKNGKLDIGQRTLVFERKDESPRRILWIKNKSPNHAILLKAADVNTVSSITIDPDSEKYFEFVMLGYSDRADANGVKPVVGHCEWVDNVYLENPSDSIVSVDYEAMEVNS